MKHAALRFVSILCTIIFIACVWFFAGCAGKQGPAGPAGKDGISAGESCQQCHTGDQTLAAMRRQWEATPHATGASFNEEGGRTACAECHNGAAFQAAANGDAITPQILADITSVNCYSCHNIHANYDTSDWALRVQTPVKMLIDTTVSIDLGKGNLCAKCHQPRSNPMATTSGTTVKVTSAHWGPHSSTQAAILEGVGGYEISGSLAKANSMHNSVVTDGCVQCHLYGNNHSLTPVLSACNSNACHPGITGFDLNATQTQIEALLAEVRDTLAALGILKIDTIKTLTGFLDSAGSPAYTTAITTEGVVGTFPKEVAGLYQNYLMVSTDGSKGVHNAKYAKYLLTNALEALRN